MDGHNNSLWKNIFHSHCQVQGKLFFMIINITLGKYNDEMLCDVVPMEATHILLGRPWQFDRR
ncbi:hypothetical protein CR513_50727, partial [Mucuna pruriens]